MRDEPETAVGLGAALRAAAMGLGIGDDEQRLRLWFRGASATKRQLTTISGHIEPLQPDLSLEGGLLRLATPLGEPLGEVLLEPSLYFSFPGISLETETLNEFHFEVSDNDGQTVALLQRSITQTAQPKEAVGRTLSTAVLSKPIILEGTDGDRLVRHVLLAEGTPLPAKASFTFAVADPGGQLRVPIYQGNRMIKELRAEIGKVDIGTAVDLSIACDEQVHIQVLFSVNSHEFGGKIEPPPPDFVPTEHEVQQLDVRFQKALEDLEEADKLRLMTDYQTTRRDLEEAQTGADYAKVIQRAADLDGLIREARLAAPLRPLLHTVENQFNACLEMLRKAVMLKPELATSSLKHELEVAFENAREAYVQRDQQAYNAAIQIITASLEFLSSTLRAPVTEDQELDISVRAQLTLEHTRQLTQIMFIVCLSAAQSPFLSVLTQHLQELQRLEQQIQMHPVDVLNRCQVLMTQLQRIYQQVSPEEKVSAELAGLLHINAQKHAGGITMSSGMFEDR